MRPLILAIVWLASWAAAPQWATALSGRVLDSEGRPVSGARVVCFAHRMPAEVLLGRLNGADPAPLAESATNVEGRFTVSALTLPAEVALRILPSGLPSVEAEGPLDPQDAEDLEFLVPAAVRISGRVVDESGAPISGVRLLAAVDTGSVEGDGAGFNETVSGRDGSFRFAAAPRETATVRAWASGYVPVSVFRSRNRSSVNVVLRRGGRIEGTVRNAAGAPVAGAVILAGGGAAVSSERGRFSINTAAEGAATVFARKEDLLGRRDGVRVRRGELVAVDLTLLPSAAIEGSIVDERTGRPVRGARVSAWEARVPWVAGGAAGESISDGRGRFRIPGLSVREYVIRATRRDYLPGSIPGNVAGISRPGVVKLALRRGAVIEGRVVDETGQAVAGARISVTPNPGRSLFLRSFGGSPTRAATTVDSGGRFRLRGIVVASSIVATKPGFVAARRDGLILSEEAARGIVLTLRHGLDARGLVVDEGGRPIGGVQVFLRPNDGSASPRQADPTESSPAAISDEAGRFLASGLAPGEHSARFLREGYPARTAVLDVRAEGLTEWPPIVLRGGVPVGGVVRDQQATPIAAAQVFCSELGGAAHDDGLTGPDGRFRFDGFPEGASVSVRVNALGYAAFHLTAPAPSISLSIVLSKAGTVRGRVEDAETKRPVENFRIGYGPPRPISVRSFSEREIQSADGTFEVTEVPPGKIEIRAAAPGYRETQIAGIDLAEGEVRENLLLSLPRGATVSGKVVDSARGAGLPNAIVGWREEGTSEGRGMVYSSFGNFANVPNSTTTDADGEFRFEGLPPGRLTFSVLHSDFLEAAKTLEASSEPRVEFSLTAGQSVRGQAVTASRTPVEGVVVSLRQLGGPPPVWTDEEARTDSAGRFEFSHLKPGRYQISGRSASGRSPAMDVVISADQGPEDLVLELGSGTLVKGKVSGLPAGQLSGVRIFGFSKGFQGGTTTGEQGEFVLRDVPPGTLRVSATTGMSIGRSTSRALEVPEGAAEASLEIVFEGASRLSGRILRRGKGVSGAYIQATPDPAPPTAARVSGETDGDGRYELNGLVDGTYRLSVSGDRVSATRAIRISGDSTLDVALEGLSLNGTVRDSVSGDPLTNVSVMARTTGSSGSDLLTSQGTTDSRGYYALENLDGGTYVITFRRPGYQERTDTVSVLDSPPPLDVSLAPAAAGAK